MKSIVPPSKRISFRASIEDQGILDALVKRASAAAGAQVSVSAVIRSALLHYWDTVACAGEPDPELKLGDPVTLINTVRHAGRRFPAGTRAQFLRRDDDGTVRIRVDGYSQSWYFNVEPSDLEEYND